MSKSTVTSKGQVTIPREIRDLAMIHEGTQLDFQVLDDGKILIIPALKQIAQLKGILQSRKKSQCL